MEETKGLATGLWYINSSLQVSSIFVGTRQVLAGTQRATDLPASEAFAIIYISISSNHIFLTFILPYQISPSRGFRP
jgi:hypothetical protein